MDYIHNAKINVMFFSFPWTTQKVGEKDSFAMLSNFHAFVHVKEVASNSTMSPRYRARIGGGTDRRCCSWAMVRAFSPRFRFTSPQREVVF
mmetsp:Transcript_50190/g.92801  ORF Transcript_50190/g.92801 Transcript_50190/m.92801 type:complete len:91 (-) Transcript_50190:187-459(-)